MGSPWILTRSLSSCDVPFEQQSPPHVRISVNRSPSRDLRDAAGTEVASARYRISREGIVVTFFVHALKGETVMITARLSAVIAIAKARSLLDDGWNVFITGPDGGHYDPVEFDRLLALAPEARLET